MQRGKVREHLTPLVNSLSHQAESIYTRCAPGMDNHFLFFGGDGATSRDTFSFNVFWANLRCVASSSSRLANT
jgi:hypothetical protein